MPVDNQTVDYVGILLCKRLNTSLISYAKDQQRTVFQPVAVAVFVMSAAWLGAKGAVTTDTLRLFVFGLPFLFAGTWLGMKLYSRIDEKRFRKVVVALIAISGAALIV